MLAKRQHDGPRHRESPHSRDRLPDICLINAGTSWQSVRLGGHWPRVAICRLGLSDMERGQRSASLFGVLAAVVVFLMGQALRYVLAGGK
jgi:hypothetical protein